MTTANPEWHDDTENVVHPFDASQPPEWNREPPPPIPPMLIAKAVGMTLVEGVNVFVHSLLYAQAMPIGRGIFVWETLGITNPLILPDIDVAIVLSGMLAVLAVGLPIVIWSLILRHHDAMFADLGDFFRRPLNLLVGFTLGLLYAVVLISEFSVIQARVVVDTGAAVIPDLSAEQSSVFTVVMMSVALVFANAAFGLASAYVFNQINRLREES